jgi:hypothetical protein
MQGTTFLNIKNALPLEKVISDQWCIGGGVWGVHTLHPEIPKF